MAYLLGEIPGRTFGGTIDSRTAQRKFKVRAQLQSEDGPDIYGAAGVPAYGDAHPKNPFMFATGFDAVQDSKTWWLWIVTVKYETPGREDAENNVEDNPLLRLPQINYDTETIMVAALGEVDATTGDVTKAVVTSAGEPYDPPPEEELDILMISITRWETPVFSLSQYRQFQNAVNDAAFTFGDLTIAIGEAKLRIRIGPTENKIMPDESRLYYRQVDYVIAVNDLGWDLSALDWGTYYIDGSGNKVNFKDDPAEGTEFGLLDGSGGKLSTGAAEFFNTWKNKKRANFAVLALPSGP